MKNLKQFTKIAAWLAAVAFVLGGLWMASAWANVPSDVVFVRVMILCVSVFGMSLCGMFILDAAIEAKERDHNTLRFRKYGIADRDARCKGYIDLTPGGNYNGLGARHL